MYLMRIRVCLQGMEHGGGQAEQRGDRPAVRVTMRGCRGRGQRACGGGRGGARLGGPTVLAKLWRVGVRREGAGSSMKGLQHVIQSQGPEGRCTRTCVPTCVPYASAEVGILVSLNESRYVCSGPQGTLALP